jgi:hypothetical protein
MASIACMVLIETDDPRLKEPDRSVQTVGGAQAVRQAVIDNLPKLTRVIAIIPEEEARFMCMAHERAMAASGLGKFTRPPTEYVSPADQS